MIALIDAELRQAALSYGARAYQADKCVDIMRELRVHRSTLAVMATGLGKTYLFAVLAALWPGRVLVLAHRKELIQQAWQKLTELTGERVGIEKAHEHSYGARIVVGSVQTLKEHRLRGISEPPFTLIIVDEAHHCTAKSYRKILAAFPEAKVLGVTATPKRADKKAMGRVFESEAGAPLDMLWGIENGWLTPLRSESIETDIDFAKLKVAKDGEFDEAALDDAISTCAVQIADAALELAGDMRMVAFAPGVKTAHVTAETMNLRQPGSARSLDGKTPDDERTAILRGHKGGAFPRLANMLVLTEGYDDPQLQVILNALPCKSRARLEQIIGRGARLWPGIEKLATVEERKTAIAASPKPYNNVFDLAGNNMEGCCASPVDILGGSYSDDEKAKAKKKLREEGGDVLQALQQARREIREAAERAALLKSRIAARRPQDPFKTMGVANPEPMHVLKPENAATPEQLRILRDELYFDIPPNCSKKQAKKLIEIGDARIKAGLCNYRQIRWLDRFGINGRQLPENIGRAIAEAYKASGPEGARQMPPRQEIERIIGQTSAKAQEGVAD
jgi:superfamily II DNA or RNA helicase